MSKPRSIQPNTNHFNYWLSPDGKFYKVAAYMHIQWMDNFAHHFKDKDGNEAWFDTGWVKIGSANIVNECHICFEKGSPVNTQALLKFCTIFSAFPFMVEEKIDWGGDSMNGNYKEAKRFINQHLRK